MKTFLIFTLTFPFLCLGQLELSEIMKGNDYIGHSPENVSWSISGEKVCYDLKKNKEKLSICYDLKSKSLDTIERSEMVFFDSDQREFLTQFDIQNNQIICWDKTRKSRNVLFSSTHHISNLQRSTTEELIYFQLGNNLYEWCMKKGGMHLKQISNFKKELSEGDKEEAKNVLKDQQNELFDYFKEKKEQKESLKIDELDEVYVGKGQIMPIQIHPNGEYMVLRKHQSAKQKETAYMSFVNEDGYTKTEKARAKVSMNEPNQSMGLFLHNSDTIMWLDFSTLTGIRNKPDYLVDSASSHYEKDREIFIHPMLFFKNRNRGLVEVRSADNKDRWIVAVDLPTGKLSELIHEHDEAWIGGPGISSWNMVSGYMEWLKDNEVFVFQSERSGYSHLYSFNLKNQKLRPLTSGNFEIRSVTKSKDPDKFYLSCNKSHPGDRNLFLLDAGDLSMHPLLNEQGAFEVSISPDEKWLASLYSSSNKPWELFLSKNKSGAEIVQLTNSTTKEFKQYNWKKPEVVSFEANDGIPIYARLYQPDSAVKNGAAVFFVHGAGYLQNAHNFWSGYYREYMFHNLLVDKGYTVFDLDYRASDGYGRDYRTAIYRFMGGRDLDDYLDAKRYVIDNLGIDSNRIGIYGGSYGGFITLMALLTKPDEFACGAALRSVTDWSHYNHEYTSNILNYPETDPEAYRKSSPIYYAENLSNPLLMLHGMMDGNVQFQDVVRLSQRFIELGKKDWELAVFPVEGHGFKTASSWTDEYRRILELFERELK